MGGGLRLQKRAELRFGSTSNRDPLWGQLSWPDAGRGCGGSTRTRDGEERKTVTGKWARTAETPEKIAIANYDHGRPQSWLQNPHEKQTNHNASHLALGIECNLPASSLIPSCHLWRSSRSLFVMERFGRKPTGLLGLSVIEERKD